MNSLDKKYLDLIEDIMSNGVSKEDRTGTGTVSVFGRQLEFDMSEGFPLLTTKKVHFKSVAHELLWFLRGETNIRSLVKEGVTIWSEWPYQNYYEYASHLEEPDYTYHVDDPNLCSIRMMTIQEFNQSIVADENFAKQFGDLGPVYGKQWRKWSNQSKKNHYVAAGEPTHNNIEIDQIANLISELKTNPDSRRLMVNAWNVADIESGSMALPPCHYGFQVYTRKLSITERIRVWEKLPTFDVLDFPIGKLTKKQCHGLLTEIGVPERGISLMWNQRSVDTFLGLPFNIASYALLLHLLADVVNMEPDKLICSLGDVHLYNNHLDFAKVQIKREPYENLPKLVIKNKRANVTHYNYDDFEIVGYGCHANFKNVPIAV